MIAQLITQTSRLPKKFRVVLVNSQVPNSGIGTVIRTAPPPYRSGFIVVPSRMDDFVRWRFGDVGVQRRLDRRIGQRRDATGMGGGFRAACWSARRDI